jgi:hypothetical protein
MEEAVSKEMHRERRRKICMVPEAAQFLEEPAVTDNICRLAADWFEQHLVTQADRAAKNINKGA